MSSTIFLLFCCSVPKNWITCDFHSLSYKPQNWFFFASSFSIIEKKMIRPFKKLCHENLLLRIYFKIYLGMLWKKIFEIWKSLESFRVVVRKQFGDTSVISVIKDQLFFHGWNPMEIALHVPKWSLE